MDELHGILTTYEMRIEQENSSIREATLKSSKKTRKNKSRSKPFSNNNDDLDNEEEANFVTKMKRGTNKYKGNIPFKLFNCGKVILLPNFVMKGVQIVMKNNFLRKKRNIRKETRK
jgi:hypothetical protein